MLFKLLSLSLLFLPFTFSSSNVEEINDNNAFILNNISGNNYEIIGVKDEYLSYSELRIYNDTNITITSINSNAFSSCTNLNSLMISYSLNYISFLPTSVKEIHYTGSKEMFDEINYIYNEDVSFFEYSYDEGFIYYWSTNIRSNLNDDICSISKATYDEMLSLYNLLNIHDKQVVDEYIDAAGIKIKESINFLKNYFSSTQQSNKTNYISQEKTMSIIVLITIIGMTTISIFYLLKKLDIIS